MALPKGYKIPKNPGANRYIKPSKLPHGDNTFRFMSDVVTGFVWFDQTPDGFKPERVKEWRDVPKDVWKRDKNKAVHFWAVVVWNYQDEALQIMEITQKQIQEPLQGYEDNEKYGDLKAYDVTIVRKGDGKDTSYVVIPSPKEPIAKEIAQDYKDAGIDLNALYRGADPFAGAVEVDEDDDEVIEVELEDVLETLDGEVEK